MDALEEKLGAVLNNPQLMQQIMSMAQSMGTSQPPPASAPAPASPSVPELDMGTLRKLTSIAGQSGTDSNQQALLKALNPYLGTDRLQRLERAMRAAKMAKLARSFLGSGLLSQLGR